ncbi:hypothetical protein Tco_0002315 [Tanacetum coccineum]
MIDLIYIPGVDSHQLRMKIFPLSLADDAKQWWINEGEGKITVWEELVEKFFCKFYPDSYDGEEEMLDGDNWGIDPLEFISRVNSSFDKHMKMDGRTKKVLFHAWMNGSWNKRRMDDSILSSNNNTESCFKPYLITRGKSDTKKEDEQIQTKCKYSNTSNSIDEQSNKRICKTEKFEAIQYSLGPDEEYIAIRRCTVFREPPYPFDYHMRRLTMEEILVKFIDGGRREHEEMEIFIKEFRTTNELLLKTRSNLLSELKIEMTSEATRSKEINETGINKNEPPRFEEDMHEKPHDDDEKNKSSSIRERNTL